MNNPRGIDFLEVWIDEYVPKHHGDLKLAQAFAKQLLRDAHKQGFTIQDMNLVGVDLAQYMLKAMNRTRAPPTDKVYLL